MLNRLAPWPTLLGLISTILASASFAATPTSPLPDLPPRVVAPTDKAEFRHLVLDNGLRVILVSDPHFNKSAAALVVGVGQIDDPFEHVGLAHFLEHMLFLGTEKYPDVNDYSAYITANGGYNNAYTSTDHTNYRLEVRHEALPGALDRFAQFFIAPLFNPDFTEREINAVNNEAMRHVQNDQRRMLNVRRELYNPAAGESKFSTGNKTTLAGATPEVVRAFYESHYSADRMALAITGIAPLDELEKLARTHFAAIPRRPVTTAPREPIFLPRKPALRLATIEPVKELRQLWLEFPVPSARPDFAAKPDELLLSLLNYAGDGGLVQALKSANLATSVGGFTWDRTAGYESLFISADLTPAGADNVQAVLETFFRYIRFLREQPFPAAFYADQARIAALNETYRDRGEGADLAADLANNALNYPLAVAERATAVWGAPDDDAYRRFLNALTPDNMLVTLQAKGVPTDRTEEIYGSAYAYTETTGAAYDTLVHPPGPTGPAAAAAPAFALPAPNPFLPGPTHLVAERPLTLIDSPGLTLLYAQDVEFERPQATIKLRFVPLRATATAESDLLGRFYETCLQDALEAAAGDATIAGLDYTFNVGLEGLDLTVTGYGDSPVRFARYVAGQLLTFDVAPARFEALRERVVRGLKSYHQTEAYQLAAQRATAAQREAYFLPDHSLERAPSVTWPEVQAWAKKTLAVGKLEALVHGHLTPDEASAAASAIAATIGAQPAPASELMERRHLALAPGTTIIDTGTVDGANSAYRANYLLPDDSPATRATAALLGTFLREPFFTELRTQQQLGYIVGSGTSSSRHEQMLLFVIQSSAYGSDELRSRAETFLTTLPAQLAALSAEQWTTLVAGTRAKLAEKSKTIAEKADEFFYRGFSLDGDWERQADTLAALDQLTQADATALLAQALDPATARRIVVLLDNATHPASTAPATFTDRTAWKTTQHFE